MDKVSPEFWQDRCVLVTGHTGFKGAWLVTWLKQMGAKVSGIALPPEDDLGIFNAARVEDTMTSSDFIDIADYPALKAAVDYARPEVILHLAAQALVLKGHADSLETYATNIMGTANLLEATRGLDGLKAVVIVTSDKVYENDERSAGYTEEDRLGGKEPYGASKACAEIVTHAFRYGARGRGEKIGIASVRAGNVIGGGDWAADRLIPDAIRAFRSHKDFIVRNPAATRPWQHVLEPLSGYLMIAERLFAEADQFGGDWAKGWNFGPAASDCASVETVANKLVDLWNLKSNSPANWRIQQGAQPYEAKLLSVDSDKAESILGWQPTWRLDDGLKATIEWYQGQYLNEDMVALTNQQIEIFCQVS